MSVQVGYKQAKARYEQRTQFLEPSGKKDNIFYKSFSTSVDDESVEKIVALASTLALTSAAEDGEYYYGTDTTNWCRQYFQV